MVISKDFLSCGIFVCGQGVNGQTESALGGDDKVNEHDQYGESRNKEL